MKVKDIMSQDVKLINPNTSVKEAAKLMREKDVGVLPVGENDKLIGMVTDRDIVIRTLANGKDITTVTIRDVMTPDCLYCFEEDTLEDLSKNMGANQIRRLPVMNRDKRLVGIVALADLCSKGSKQAAAEALTAISQKKH